MIIGRKSSFDEVCLEILRHERHAVIHHYGSLPDGLDALTSMEANTSDSEKNRQRLLILRGYRQPLIDNMPTDTEWFEATLDVDDYTDLCVIASSGWDYFSEFTRRVSETAKVFASQDRREALRARIAGERLPDSRDANDWIDEQIANISRYEVPRIREGTLNYRLVLLKDSSNRVAIIEGNHRAVAIYAIQILQNIVEFVPHSVLFGASGHPCCWNWSKVQ